MVADGGTEAQLGRRIPMAIIDKVVSARLGQTRVQGNAQPAVFNRQIAMYLAKHVGGWSTTRIGRFYNGRDHSTVYREAEGALLQIASQWKERFEQMEAATPGQEHVPPVLILVCDNTDIAEVFYQKISGETEEAVVTEAEVEEVLAEDDALAEPKKTRSGA